MPITSRQGGSGGGNGKRGDEDKENYSRHLQDSKQVELGEDLKRQLLANLSTLPAECHAELERLRNMDEETRNEMREALPATYAVLEFLFQHIQRAQGGGQLNENNAQL